MAKTKQQTEFHLSFRVTVDTDITVSADTIEEALAKGAAMKPTDVIEIPGSHNDSNIIFTGIYRPLPSL